MTKSEIQKLSSLSNKAQDWLKAELICQLESKSYRDLARITGLNLKTILKNIIELQKKENVSINFLLNSIVMDFFKNNKEGNLSVSH